MDKQYIEDLAIRLLRTTETFTLRGGSTTAICLADLGWTFAWSATRRALGTCCPHTKTISVSAWLVEHSNATQDIHEDTLRHEIAHAYDFTIRSKSSHDWHWKMIARRMGATPSPSIAVSVARGVAKYDLVCEQCDAHDAVHQRTTATYICGRCRRRGVHSTMKLIKN